MRVRVTRSEPIFAAAAILLLACQTVVAGPGVQVRVALQSESGGSSLLDERITEGRQALQVAPTLSWSWEGRGWSSGIFLAPSVDLPARRPGSELSSVTGLWRVRARFGKRVLLAGRLWRAHVDFQEDTRWLGRDRTGVQFAGQLKLQSRVYLDAVYEHTRSRYGMPDAGNHTLDPAARLCAAAGIAQSDKSRGHGPPDWARERQEEQKVDETPLADPAEERSTPAEELTSEESGPDTLDQAAFAVRPDRRSRRHEVETGVTWVEPAFWVSTRVALVDNGCSLPGYRYRGFRINGSGDWHHRKWVIRLRGGSEWRRYDGGGKPAVWNFLRVAGELSYGLMSWVEVFATGHRETGRRGGERAFDPWTFVSAGVRVSFDLGTRSRDGRPERRSLAPQRRGHEWVFRYQDHGADTVQLVGTFNDWSAAGYGLEEVGEGVWEIAVQLGPGAYEYAFLVDGKRWVSPPRAPMYADDGFGNRNGVLVVAAEEESR